MERGAPRPKFFHVQDDSYRTGWSAVKHDLSPSQTDTELFSLGWTFFYMANVIRKSAGGFDREKATAKALKRVMARVREDGCNSLQVEAVEPHSFLGIPYISVSARPRHLQKGSHFRRQPLPGSNDLSPFMEVRARKTIA